MIFIRVSAGVEVLKYVWEERWTSINFPHDKYYRLSCNQYTALHYCYITRFLCIFQQFFCLWLIGEAQFPNIQHESLLYPGRGAAGYEYCGLMMNVANIETQYRELGARLAGMATLCVHSVKMSSEASTMETGDWLEATSEHLNYRSGCRAGRERLREAVTVVTVVSPRYRLTCCPGTGGDLGQPYIEVKWGAANKARKRTTMWMWCRQLLPLSSVLCRYGHHHPPPPQEYFIFSLSVNINQDNSNFHILPNICTSSLSSTYLYLALLADLDKETLSTARTRYDLAPASLLMKHSYEFLLSK